jgi:hypothetical protein
MAEVSDAVLGGLPNFVLASVWSRIQRSYEAPVSLVTELMRAGVLHPIQTGCSNPCHSIVHLSDRSNQQQHI